MILILKLGRKLKRTELSLNIPRGPWKLPIIGNLHQLVTSTPHRKLRDLAKIYGPMMHLQLGEIFTIVVSSAEYAEEILKTHDVNFASRPKFLVSEITTYEHTSIAFAPYGEYWRQVRKICAMELLSPKRVNSFRSIREEEFTNLVKMVGSHEGSPINLTEAVHSSVCNIISRAAFGMKCKDKEEFISIIKEGVKVAAGFNIGDLFPSAKWLQHVTGLRSKLEKLFGQIDRILGDIINEHKEAKSKAKEGNGKAEEDLLAVLLKYEEGNASNQGFSLTINNIKAVTSVRITTTFVNPFFYEHSSFL